MQNCIFSGHCLQLNCDQSCPTLAETSYLLERNGISMASDVFHANPDSIQKYSKLLEANNNLTTIVTSNTVKVSELITYVAICKNWKGSQLHCTVYNLKYSDYVESIQNSWTKHGDSENVEMVKIWANSAKVLIISNLDYVNFKDFQCQTLLSLIQARSSRNLPTIVVTPVISSLVGNSPFFSKLTKLLSEAVR